MTAALPPAYAWLANLSVRPRMIDEALKLLGTVEWGGEADNPLILGWAKEVGVQAIYTHDSVPWCGLFMAVVAKRAGKQIPSSPLWALSWDKFGEYVREPGLGDVLTFSRNGGGHVALYVGEDADAYHVLGGNQHDCVCFARIAKGRLHAARRPLYHVQPATVAPVQLATTGALSENEA